MPTRFSITHGPYQGASCSQCRRERDRRRGSAHRRGYTKHWQRIVKLAIQAQPWCSDCGATSDLTGDHITPRVAGGGNVPSNIRVLCRSCNSSRGAKLARPRMHDPVADDDPPLVG